MKNNLLHDYRGNNLISLIVAMGIFGLVVAGVTTFQVSIFRQQKQLGAQSKADQEILMVVRAISRELRTARSSATGSFILDTAENQQIIFYADARDDGTVERIHYFFDRGNLKRGVIQPTGNPAVYNALSETVTTVAERVLDAPLFTYYGDSFNGVTQTTPLPSPINLADVRVVKFSMTVDVAAPNVPDAHAETHITIRNVRDL